MSKVYLLFRAFLLVSLVCLIPYSAVSAEGYEDRKIVVTSDSLEVDSHGNTAVFQGSVVATVDTVTIYADRMQVSYSASENKVREIHALGNVKVVNEEKAIFSQEAKYIHAEEKILLTGNPKVVEGENTISGARIIYFVKDNRALVEESRVILRDIKTE